MSNLDWEQISFKIITEAGSAKSSAMEALYAAKDGDYEQAKTKLKQANEEIGRASQAHFDVIAAEAQGMQLEFKVLFLHAEDQLLTTQTLLLLVSELIDLHQKIDNRHQC